MEFYGEKRRTRLLESPIRRRRRLLESPIRTPAGESPHHDTVETGRTGPMNGRELQALAV